MPVNQRLLAAVAAREAALANQARGQTRGVQVSPIKAAQAQQTLARGAATNQARQIASQAGKSQTDLIVERMGGLGPGAKKPGGGGVGGVVGGALHLGKTAFGLLDVPRRVVISGMKELADKGGKPGTRLFGNVTDESTWSDFISQVKDPNFGFGTVIGNAADSPLLNRIIGFAGDVALDPMTYTTGGLDKIPGSTGRISLAKEAFAKGLSEDVIKAAGKSGARGVRGIADEAIREEAIRTLNLPKPGRRFGGREGVRLPLTGKVDEGLAAVLERVRAPFTDTVLGRTARKAGAARTPLLREATESLATRGEGKYTPSVAAALLTSEDTARGLANYTEARFERLADDVARHGKDDPEITHALERGDISHKAAATWDDLNSKVFDAQQQAGVSVGKFKPPNPDLAPNARYVVHVPTEQGAAAFGHETSNVSNALVSPQSSQFERRLVPQQFANGEYRAYRILGKDFKPILGTIEEANAWSVPELGFKLYEDSPGRLAAHTLIEARSAIKHATPFVELAKSGPKASELAAHEISTKQKVFGVNDPRVTMIDPEATRAASAVTGGKLADRLEPLLKGLSDAEQVAGRTGQAVSEADTALAQYEQQALRAQRKAYGSGYAKANEAQAAHEAAMRLAPDMSEQIAPLQAGLSQAQEAEAAARQQVEQHLNDLVQRPGAVETPTPGATPLHEALQSATGARQGIEEQLAPLLEAQGAHEALGPPPNIDQIVAEHAAPVLEQLAAGRQDITAYRFATQMSDIAAQAGVGANRAKLEAEIAKLPEQAQAMMRQTLTADRSPQAMGSFLGDIRAGKLDDNIIRMAKEGYERMETDRLIGRNIIIDSEMKAAMEDSKAAMERFNAAYAKERHLVAKVIDEMTKMFKSWALATPGQHIRNGMSATFMNMSDGVLPSEMLDGIRIAKAFRKNPAGDWVADLPARLQPHAEDVMKAVYASGAGGQYTAAEIGVRAFGDQDPEDRRFLNKAWHFAYENRVTKGSHNVGERWVEAPVRAGLALNSIRRPGGSWEEAVSRIRRIHFDYSEVNELDRGVRRLVPFWTFMSRNLPLQVQQMWTSPRAYLQYNSFMRNMNVDPEGNMPMPDWLAGTGAVFLNGSGLALAPDVGASQVQNYLGQIADPKRLMQNLTPPLKSIIELATNTDIYYNQPYKKNDLIKPGWELTPVLPVLAALGLTTNTAQGPVIEKKVNEAVRDNIPVLAQLNRLFSTTSDRAGKGRSSQLGYIGVPVRQVNLEGEQKSRMFDQRQEIRDRQSLYKALAKYGGAA
jgi:hypothetical protein